MVLRSQRHNRCKKNCKRYADNSSCAHNKQIAGRTSVEQAIPITELLQDGTRPPGAWAYGEPIAKRTALREGKASSSEISIHLSA